MSRSKAEEILNAATAEAHKQDCALNIELIKKPEFSSLVTVPVCSQKFNVIGIIRESETRSVVEAIIVRKYDEKVAQDWIKSFIKLEKRLLQLSDGNDRQASTRAWFKTTRYIDPADGQVFVNNMHSTDVVVTIRDTREWNQLQEIKKNYMDASGKKEQKSEPMHLAFDLYDDGWRLYEKKRKRR